MVTKLQVYPVDHPVAVALIGMARAQRSGASLLECLAEQAASAGVPYGSPAFDEAAALAGIPYCRRLDLYCPRSMH